MEQPSPHKIAIATLLNIFVSPKDENFIAKDQFAPFMFDLSAADIQTLEYYLMSEISLIDNAVERSWSDLFKSMTDLQADGSALLLRSCHDFLKNEWLAKMTSVDALSDHLDNLNRLISSSVEDTDDLLPPNGKFGKFLRRLIVAVDYLTFSGLVRLFEQIEAYKNDSTDFSINLEQNKNEEIISNSTFYVSSRQLQMKLQNETEHVIREEGALELDSINEIVTSMLKLIPTLPRAFYLRYISAMMQRDFDTAIDNFHRYFDFPLHAGGPSQQGGSQYVTLNLGALYFHFGHLENALEAMYETIHISQRINDEACIVSALAWMHRILAKMEGSKDSLVMHALYHALQLSCELNFHYISALSYLSAAKYAIANMGRLVSSPEFHTAYASDPQCVVFHPLEIPLLLDRGSIQGSISLIANSINHNDRKPSNNHKNLNSMKHNPRVFSDISLLHKYDLFSQSLSLRSTLWSYYGCTPLVEMPLKAIQELNHYHAANPTAESVILQYCQSSANILNTLPLSFNRFISNIFSSRDMVMSDNFSSSSNYSTNKTSTIKTSSAVFVADFVVKSPTVAATQLSLFLRSLRELLQCRVYYPTIDYPIWYIYTCTLLLKRSIRRCQRNRAAYYASLSLGLVNLTKDYKLYLEVKRTLAWQHIEEGKWKLGLKELIRILDACRSEKFVLFENEILCDISEVLIEYDSDNTSDIFSYILPCISFCGTHSQFYLLYVRAIVVIASLHLLLNAPESARLKLVPHMSYILQHAPPSVVGQAYLTLSRIDLCLIHNQIKSDLDVDADRESKMLLQSKLYHRSLVNLSYALNAFISIEYLRKIGEVLYLQSRILHELVIDVDTSRSIIVNRNITAHRYQKVMDLKYNNAAQNDDVITFLSKDHMTKSTTNNNNNNNSSSNSNNNNTKTGGIRRRNQSDQTVSGETGCVYGLLRELKTVSPLQSIFSDTTYTNYY